MAISGVNQLSTEQLMSMAMGANGQLTNDSASTNDTGNEMNLAFALMMKELMNSSNNSSQLANGEKNDANVIQQNATGKKLEDIAMILKNFNSINGSTSTETNASTSNMNGIYSAVESASKKYGVDKNLILAIIKQESNFDSSAVSSAGATGLMQLMPQNFADAGISDGTNVQQNVNGGTKLLKEYLDKYNGNVEMALMAYNGGPGTMQRRGVASTNDIYKMPQETQNYVPKVMGYYKNGI